MKVSFGSYSADLGNEINANYVENQPSSVNWHSKPDGNYTIALIGITVIVNTYFVRFVNVVPYF